MTFTWKKTKNSLPNLYVLWVGGREVGFITKPKDTATDKNAWRLHKGIGAGNEFLGHDFSKRVAMDKVEMACGRVVGRGDKQIIEN